LEESDRPPADNPVVAYDPEARSPYPKFTRPQAVGIVLALVVVGGTVGVWAVSAGADVPPRSVIGPFLAGLALGVASGVSAYFFTKPRRERGERVPGTAWAAAAGGVGIAIAVLLRDISSVVAALLGFCLGVPAAIIFLVHVWPRRGEPYD
jgi:membrane associated rhomboid family serine protease